MNEYRKKVSDWLNEIHKDIRSLKPSEYGSIKHWNLTLLTWHIMTTTFRNPDSVYSEIYLKDIRQIEGGMRKIIEMRLEKVQTITKEMESFKRFDPKQPKVELNKSIDLKEYDTNEIKWEIPYHKWISLSKQAKVELLAGMAREDRGLSYHVWHNNFKLEFPEGYSVEMGRYKKKFRRSNRGEQFAINGLAFYKKNR